MRTQTGRNRSPWNEPECGQLYSRAMAHWNLYDQACGASFDSTQAALSFDPRFTQAVSGGERAFRCLFLAENGWGEFKQSGPAGLPSGTVSLSAAWGTVKLRSLKIVSTYPAAAKRNDRTQVWECNCPLAARLGVRAQRADRKKKTTLISFRECNLQSQIARPPNSLRNPSAAVGPKRVVFG